MTEKDLTESLDAQLSGTERSVGERGSAHTAVLRRTYDADVADVWEAITTPERIARWFLPVTGDLRLGGRYQIEGNAGGEIVRCEPPHLLTVTWIFGDTHAEGDVNEVEVRLSATDDGRTLLELEHAATVDPGMWSMFGPGAVGVGWDLTLLGLDLFLGGGAIDDAKKPEWIATPEARDFMARSSAAWGAAFAASGADPDQVAAAVEATTKFYAPDAPPAE
ncbi:uncharacterized protein YndB with AHSA1/START domain [Allocatelliglobosispora scoriae]|uniref:Uncharacterized protein YndB with AHSA1/START domain n=1 Tax=Allocatelliglobosispora scoriae TaxID=643052 RepID=A0A841C248_9ACTN|nr:SRPBCC family protein [Allocatelliglobosispora scoriae]MBB5872941.1 uncharacterized protein YndB with AHSA1/START domain [Allocatelliglobosispora scoriae]